MKQQSFAASEFAKKPKQTRREKFWRRWMQSSHGHDCKR